MATLYHLQQEYKDLLNKILYEDYETEEERESLIDELVSYDLDIEEKIENTAIVIAEFEADTDKVNKEIARLQARTKRNKNTIDRLQNGMLYAMKATGKEEVKTEHYNVKIRNYPVVFIEDESKVPDEYMSIKVTESRNPNKVEIKKALKDGEILDFARLVDNEKVSIK